MRVDNLTPVVSAAPGERATCRLRIENTEHGPVVYALRVVGFDEGQVFRPPSNGPLESGAAEEIDLEFVIPDAFAAGDHSVAVEVTPDRPGAAPVIAPVTVSVGSIDAVALAVQPSTIRGRRRGKFRVDIDNRSVEQMDVELAGEGPDLEVTLRPDRIRLLPGDRVHTSGRVKGPRHLVGEPRQHSLTVTARSRSAPSYAPATFRQRPLFPRSLRTLLVLLTVVGLWAGALGAGFYWWSTRDDEEPEEAAAELVDTDGDGQADTPADQLIDTDGDGVPDKLAAVVAEEVADGLGDEPQAGGSDLPTNTVVGGTVKAGETGEDSDVAVTLTPIELGAPPPAGAAFVGSAGESRGAVKLWPARAFVDDRPGQARARQTVSVESTASGPDGAWLFSDVPIRQNYKLQLAKPGFDSQAFVVTPPADGSPVELEVVLEPASGELSGSVAGPNGPLGNVDLVLTDGTLTFNTTTASGTEPGTWALTGISTPGTYTLTATLDGFGTEVLQVELEPGEQRTGVDISMTPGVGSILGRISSGADPLGRVTLSASNGEDTLTTTSLTEGDTGLYSFPRLDIPGRYTVTASRDGYITQTRLVTLDGNATGVNFNMVRTTATIEGVVTSVGRNGRGRGPLPGVSITVRRDDLMFNITSSSSDRDPGSFRIFDLPPGDYVVEFFHHRHDEASQLVTVAAGEDLDLGDVPLRFIGRPREPNTGTLTVDVTDSRGEPLRGATVALYDVADEDLSDPVHEIEGTTQTSFRFPEGEETLEVGTYQVVVTHEPLYNVAVRTKSVGLEDEELVVALFRRGQVRGQLINSHNRQPLNNYTLHIVPLDSAGNPDPERLPREVSVGPETPDPRTGEILWEVDPNQPLAAGDYELRVPGPTRGFRFARPQVLQQGQRPMRFEIPADNENPITLNDLELDPLPIVRGRVVAPRLDDPNDVSFDDINVDDLDVDFRCGPSPPNPVVGADVQNRDGLDGDDFYVLDRTLVSDALVSRVGDDCTLTVRVTSGQYLSAEVPVTVQPSRNPADAVVVVNVALFKPSDVGGRVYWLDRGASSRREVPVQAAEVRTQGVVITGFTPGVGGDPTPDLAERDLTATSDDDGRWVFGEPRQVFGRATYRFSVDPSPDPPEFEPRSITITIDEEDGRTVAPVGTSQPPLELDNGTGTGNNIGVELEANGGSIVGQVELFTIKGTDAFPESTANLGGFSMTLDRGPASTPFARVSGSPPTGRASVRTGDPGTYEASVTAPDANHVSRRAQPAHAGMTLFQNPGRLAKETAPVIEPPDSLVSFTRQFVELGHIDVRVVDAMEPENPLADAVLDVTGQPPRADVDENGEASFPGLAVDHGDPTGSPMAYAVTPDIDGFDLSATSFTVDTEAEGLGPDDATPDDVVCAPPTNCSTADLGIVAGGHQTVTFRIPEYGSISGRVLGQTRVPADRVALRIGEGLTVTARRITDAAGNFLPTPETVPADDIVLDLDDPAGPRFRFSGRPGQYTIAVDHPAYEDTPLEVPPAQTITNPDTGESFDVYRMSNFTPATPAPNDLAAPWVLQAERGSLDITVHQDTLAGPGVPTATVAVFDLTANAPVDLGANSTTGSDGRLVVPALIAGNYRLEIRKQDAEGDLFFPVIATVNVPEGDSPETRTRVVRAPLPRIGGAIVGTVGAINSEGNPLLDRLPVPAGIVVSREYTGGPSIEVAPHPSIPGTVATVPNEASESDLSLPPAPTEPPPTSAPTTGPPTSPPASPPTTAEPPARTRPRTSVRIPANAAGTPQEYRFENVASGVHELTFGDVPGFDTPEVVPAPTVLGIATTNIRQVDYVAANRTVVVNVSTEGSRVGDATVRLTHPDGDNRIPTVSDGTYTFSGVPPEVQPYTLVVTKALHRVSAPPEPIRVPVPVGVGDLPEIDVTLVANAATISGVARKQTAPGATSPLTSGSVQLIKLPAGSPVDTRPPDESGNYTFTVNEAGEYRVRVLGPPPSDDPPEPGYATRESASFTVTLGQVVTTPTVPTVVVPRLATFSITVNGPPGSDTTVTPVIAPTTPPPHPPAQSRSGNTFTVRVDPDYTYRFRLSSPFFLTETVPLAPVDPAPGETGSRLTITETLDPRTVSGRVTVGSPAVGVADANVRATKGTETRNAATSDGPPPPSSPPVGAYSMPRFDEGTWSLVSEKLGVGRNTRDVVVPADSPSITGADITLLPRLVDVSFTVEDGGSSARITLTNVTGGTVASGTTTDGEVTLEARENLFPLTWRATMSPRIPKTDTVSITGLSGTLTQERLAVTVPQIPLDLPTLTGRVLRPNGDGANNTTVFACLGATGTCDSTTTGVITRPTNGTGGFSLQPTASGTWRLHAVRGTETTTVLRTFTVSAEGVLNPTSVTLNLVASSTPP